MLVPVVLVRPVHVAVHHRLVDVLMAVRALAIVAMAVMYIVLVNVGVGHPLMPVRVRVPLGQ